jgi:Spy/CpxP family protein refolding chaperone
MSFTLLAQVPVNRYEALQHALELSDFQLWQAQSSGPVANNQSTPTAGPGDVLGRRAFRTGIPGGVMDPPAPARSLLADRILNRSQQAQLAAIEKILHADKMASLAIVAGLIGATGWPGAFPCGYYPARTSASELDLSDSQLEQLERLEGAAREPVNAQAMVKQKQRQELLNSGARADSPAVIQLESDMSNLWKQAAETRPRRDQALAILDDAQKAKLWAFETALELAREAIELKLIMPWPQGEVLCP